MSGATKRLARIFVTYSIKILSLLLAVSVISFVLVTASPVDPVQQYIMGLGTAVSPEQRAEIEEYWGVNEPPVERFFSWLNELLHGNLGESAIFRRPVADVIGERFVNSLALMLCAWLLAGLIGFALGCVMGMYRNRWPDKILKKVCYILSSVPTFWLGLLFLLIFGVWLKWFPDRLFLAHRSAQFRGHRLAEDIPSYPARIHSQPHVLCQYCSAYPSEAR